MCPYIYILELWNVGVQLYPVSCHPSTPSEWEEVRTGTQGKTVLLMHKEAASGRRQEHLGTGNCDDSLFWVVPLLVLNKSREKGFWQMLITTNKASVFLSTSFSRSVSQSVLRETQRQTPQAWSYSLGTCRNWKRKQLPGIESVPYLFHNGCTRWNTETQGDIGTIFWSNFKVHFLKGLLYLGAVIHIRFHYRNRINT